MNVSVTGKHIPHDHEIRDVARQRMEELRHYYDGLMDAHVVIDAHPNRVMAEVRVHTTDGHVFVSRKEERDIWVAFDEAYENVKRQIVRHKKLLRQHHVDKDVVLGLGAEETGEDEGAFGGEPTGYETE